MARCNCNGQTCGCRLQEGTGVSITGAGTPADPWVISAEGGGGGGDGGWDPGDRKESYRTVTPAGWLECNGQAVSRATYADLFSAIGTTYGAGDGSTTFNVPSEVGRTTVGAGSGYPQGATGGASQTTLTEQNLPPHSHGMTHTHAIDHDHAGFTTPDGGGHNHQLHMTDANASSNNAVARGAASGGGDSAAAVNNSQHTHFINVPPYTGDSGGSSKANTDPVGGGLAFTNMPPYRAVRVLIKT